MLYTLVNVRDNLRTRDGKRVFFLGKGDQLTSEARDFLSRERIEIRPAEQAKITCYRLLGGGFVKEKLEHMTHLTGDLLVRKDHPRIVFRGAIDRLEAELLLCQLKQREPVRKALGEILALTRRILRAEVLDEPVPEEKLCGMTQQQLREHSHRPQEFYGQPHFMPGLDDGEQILSLNRVRCAVREAEIAAVRAFSTETGPVREDILRAMNRLSSMVYILMIREKAGK